ncbi:protein NRT1/ PTR FAMILY 2.6-like [Pyrus ussuriensis x Pyrus communis]|uniref:Protein NRT1/ PTR FAMILY 2.6-like n=1 Tax=Pyrus ussuriensis x Pyrus communis TaxID=2448454 RepID=A0A5N5GGS1_9ROSA|nr:protein NRT1/ PTR FAMILY 2.6-like [Pyrus ussuriensis x Pyrus communis]
MDESLSHADISSDSGRRRGGWITFPFIFGALGGLTLAAGGWISNLIVFLIEEFNVNSIDAAQISNVVYGSFSFFPIIGAIIADSFFGSFYVISISSCMSLLGIVLLVLTTALNSLKPQPCATGSKLCQPTSALQYAVLYTGITLASLGLGGTRYTLATLGANQFDKPKHQAMVAFTVIVYVEDNVSFKWGFGLCVIANLIGMAIFFSGSRFYKFDKPQGSPFVGFGRVIVASVRKTSLQLSTERKDYYYGHDGVTNKVAAATLSKSFRIFPLWSTALFLATPIAIQSSMSVLQALTMDRHIGPHFKMPSGSVIVIVLFSTSIFLTLIDRFLCPMWQKFTGQFPSPLQRVGVGHVLTILSMAVSAVMDTSTAMISLIIGIAYYVSTGVVNMVQRVTGWLPNNLNNGKLDNVYWMLAVLGVINFGYYLVCAKLYRYQNVKGADGSPDPDS